jgi:hypothetical protein
VIGIRRFAFAASVLSGACSVSSDVGSRWLASGDVTVAGGTIQVEDGRSTIFAGAELHLPPLALHGTTMIGVAPGASLAAGDWIAAGPAVEWDPVDTVLNVDADFALPVQLPGGRAPDDLLVLSANLPTPIPGVFDGNHGVLRFQANHLGDFQAVMGKACASRDGCAQGNSCVHGYCRPGSGPNH